MSHNRFTNYNLFCVSQTAISAVLHCNLTDRLVVKIWIMLMSDGVRSILSGVVAPLGERGESIAMGQVSGDAPHNTIPHPQRLSQTQAKGT